MIAMNDKAQKQDQGKDWPIEITKVVNGWIVEPRRGPMDNYARGDCEVYVFQTFDALTKWLDEHFTKPLKK